MKTQRPTNINRVLTLFSSMQFAIGLICALAFFSIIGTVIAQNRSTNAYRAQFGDLWYSVFNYLDFFDMYHSWWFKTLLACLLLSLITATLRHGYYIYHGLKPINKVPTTPNLHANKVVFQIDGTPGKSIQQVSKTLQTELKLLGFNHFIHTSPTGHSLQLFSRKGWLGKFSFFPVHIGLITILIGGLISTQMGFRGVMNIVEGEQSDKAFIKKGDDYIPVSLPFSIKNEQFIIDFYKMGKPSSFKSRLTAYDLTGNEHNPIATKTISVNDPLRIADITLYQANFGDAGSSIQVLHTDLSKLAFPQQTIKSAVHKILEDSQSGSRITIVKLKEHTVLNLSQTVMEKRMKDVGPSLEVKIQTPEDGTITYISYLHYPQILSFKKMGDEKTTTVELGFSPTNTIMVKRLAAYLDALYKNGDKNAFTPQEKRQAFALAIRQYAPVNEDIKAIAKAITDTHKILRQYRLPALFTFKTYDRKLYTGLQVTKDPGAWVIWVGCFLLIAGLLLIYIVEYRIWIKITQVGSRHFDCELVTCSAQTAALGMQQLSSSLKKMAEMKGVLINEEFL